MSELDIDPKKWEWLTAMQNDNIAETSMIHDFYHRLFATLKYLSFLNGMITWRDSNDNMWYSYRFTRSYTILRH